MPLGYAELERFYEGLVISAREQGITCAITSGMACVAFGVAQTTRDCDVLCVPEAAERLLVLLTQTQFEGALPGYRGHITPPLEARWLRGGWTSHFVWRTGLTEAYLDIFGVAPRASSPWDVEFNGLYAGQHTVAEMKRTDREKDWPFATALGVKLLEAGDARGWLHIFNYEVLLGIAERLACPPEMVDRRPVLGLLAAKDERLEVAIKAEMEFWQRLDKLRMRIYERAARPFMLAVKQDVRSDAPELLAQHAARVEQAERLLAQNPLQDYGLERMLAEARELTARFVPPGSLEWLPDARKSFIGLGQ